MGAKKPKPFGKVKTPKPQPGKVSTPKTGYKMNPGKKC